MKGRFLLPLILSALAFAGCQRDRGVYAGNDIYQPRPAPVQKKPASQQIQGELSQVDLRKNMLIVRVENGMAQTFKFDEDTALFGLDAKRPAMQDLAGKEGSELTVQWQDEDGAKLATRIDVTQVSRSKSASVKRRGR